MRGNGRASSASLRLEHPAERAAWDSTASCVVVGDVSGALHFVAADGELLYSMQVAKASSARRWVLFAPRFSADFQSLIQK